MQQILDTEKLEKIVRNLVVNNHKTTLMALDQKQILQKLGNNSIAAMRNSIIEKSPLFIFSRMSIPGFFVSNEYVVKNASFSSEEEDVLLTLMENIRFEFGADIDSLIIDKKKIKSELYITIVNSKLLLGAYILALHKDIIIIEAENVAITHLENSTNYSNGIMGNG